MTTSINYTDLAAAREHEVLRHNAALKVIDTFMEQLGKAIESHCTSIGPIVHTKVDVEVAPRCPTSPEAINRRLIAWVLAGTGRQIVTDGDGVYRAVAEDEGLYVAATSLDDLHRRVSSWPTHASPINPGNR